MDKYDVIIIGGGIVGSAVAYSLAAAPDFSGSIAVVERDPTYEFSSTVKATGVIRSQFSTPDNIRMSLYSSNFIKNITEHLSYDGSDVDVGFHEHGYMILATDQSIDRFRESHSYQMQNGADVDFLDKDQLAETFPLIQNEDVIGGFLSRSNDGSFDPWALLQAFRRKAKSLGVEFIHDTAVGLEQADRKVNRVQLEKTGWLSAGYVVNAGGARDAAKLAAMVKVTLPVEPRIRTTYYVGTRVDLKNQPMTILPSGIWMRPEGDGFLCGHTPDEEQDQPTHDFPIDYDSFEEILWPLLWETFPDFDALKLISAYSGHYDYNVLDENGILGLTPNYDNFYIATGFSGHGVMHAPATGKAISDLIIHNQYQDLDVSQLGYNRILENKPIRELNVF